MIIFAKTIIQNKLINFNYFFRTISDIYLSFSTNKFKKFQKIYEYNFIHFKVYKMIGIFSFIPAKMLIL